LEEGIKLSKNCSDWFDISDVVALLPNEADTLIFSIAIRSGRLDYFEAVTVSDVWPASSLSSAQLMYFDKMHPKGRKDRDLFIAREQWLVGV